MQDPPQNTPIYFLAGEWGCTPHLYPGFCWQSTLPGQPLKFYIYPWALGFDRDNPPFNAPPYLGEWQPIRDQGMLDFINNVKPPKDKKAGSFTGLPLFEGINESEEG